MNIEDFLSGIASDTRVNVAKIRRLIAAGLYGWPTDGSNRRVSSVGHIVDANRAWNAARHPLAEKRTTNPKKIRRQLRQA